MLLSEYLDSVKTKKIAVIGIGVSNTGLIEMLLKNGCEVLCCDKKERSAMEDTAAKLEAMGAKLSLGADYLKNIEADIIFKTPGIRPDIPELEAARKAGALITSEMEEFFEVCPCRIIAVTGSDGKTTTTTIISELLKAAGKTVHTGGNIGKPLFVEAGDMKPDDYAVLELSSFQLMTMRRSADIAVVTNVTPNHLDYHTGMDEYTQAKKNVFLHQGPEGLLVVNADNEVTASFESEAPGRCRAFSRRKRVENGFFAENESVFRAQDGKIEKLLDFSDIKLPGLHNVENYMAAFCAVYDIVGPEVCRRVAAEFGGVEHRIELVREKDGVKFYNDSIASSPTRTLAGLRSFRQKLILIAGGYDKKIPFDELGRELPKYVKTLVLTGATAQKIKQSLLSAPEYSEGNPAIIEEDDFERAVKAAAACVEKGDIVILSPACASFDRFKNFAERGNTFKNIVNSL